MEESFTVLVADGSSRNRNVLRSFLSVLGYAVKDAITGSELLSITQNENPDLILLDSRIIEPDAFFVVKELKSKQSTKMIPVLLMTALDDKDRRIFAIESGADDMLLKPLDKLELTVRIKSLIRTKFYHDQLLKEREKVEKMKEDFLAMITHDLKTPLTVIIGNIGLVMMTLEKKGEKLKELTAIDIASRNLLLLVNNLLNVMKVDSAMMTITREDFSLDRLTEEVVAMITPIANKKNVSLTSKIPRETWVNGDSEKIRQVLSNLISNATKFTPESGEVAVSTAIVDGSVVIEVSDTGLGISPDDAQRLFKRFSQKKGEKGGTGLGLYIVKKMLEMHDADIQIRSQVGQGATFFFSLPKVLSRKEQKGVPASQ